MLSLHSVITHATTVIGFQIACSIVHKCQVHLKAWEKCLPHVEFSYNRVVNSTTYSSFEVVYGSSPLSPLNLLPLLNTSAMMNRDGLSKANFVKSLHEKVKAQIEKKVEQYARYSNNERKRMVIKPSD